MRVVMISADPLIADPTSAVRTRLREYAGLVDGLTVINIVPVRIGVDQSESPTIRYWSGSRALVLIRALVALWRTKRPDLVTTQDPFWVGLIGWLFARFTFTRLHVQVHTDVLSPHLRRGSRGHINYLIARFVIKRADRLRVVSRRIKDSLIRMYPADHIDVLPIFVDVVAIASAVPADPSAAWSQFQPRVLAVGRLESEKCFDRIISAIATLADELPTIGLVIIGSGRLQNALEQHAQAHGVAERVAFLPWRPDVARYYKIADATVIASEFEGYSLVAVEALAAGCPLVMTDVGVAGELVRDGQTGRVVPVGDQQALVTALGELLNQPEVGKRYAQAGQDAVQAVMGTKSQYLDSYLASWRRTLDL